MVGIILKHLSNIVGHFPLVIDDMDVRREKIEVMVSDYGALLKDKCSLVLENLDFERKLTKVEKEKMA